MSFRCQFCGVTQAPRVKPIFVTIPTDVRTVSYSNQVIDPESEEEVTKVSTGTEKVAEFLSCPPCQGITLAPAVEPDFKAEVATIHAMHLYAQKSNKRIDEDKVMQVNLGRYHSFPLQALSKGLEDPKVPSPKWKLSNTVAWNVLARIEKDSIFDQESRTVREAVAIVPVVKGFIDRGGVV